MNLSWSYLLIFFRQIRTKALFAVVSIFGLSLSITATLVIVDYVAYERSYDTMHQNHRDIYRVTTHWNPTETPQDQRATTVQWSGPGAKEQFPEIRAFTRLMPISRMTGENTVEYNGKSIQEQEILLADPGFFEVFSFQLLNGHDESALSESGSVVISESIARKYFGDISPLGKPLRINSHGNLSKDDFIVTGVIEDAPVNSHFKYDFLVSMSSMWKELESGSTYWHWDNTYCYLLLERGADPFLLGEKMTKQRVSTFQAELKDWPDVVEFKLQPLADIHLNSMLKGEIGVNGHGRYLDFLSILALSILMSACINFINLAVSRAIEGQKEIGIRTVTGSTKWQLTLRSIIEVVVITLVAVLIGVALVPATIIGLESLFDISWSLEILNYVTPSMWTIIAAIILGMITLSLLYPLVVIHSIKPAIVLKGSRMPVSGRWPVRNYLVVLQFVVCIFFALASAVVYLQTEFMRNHDPGFDRESVVVVKGFGFQPCKVHQQLKAQLARGSSIRSVGLSSAAPGDEIVELSLRPRLTAGASERSAEIKLVTVDEDFFETVGIRLVAGRGFTPLADRQSVIVNHSAVKALGFNDDNSILNQSIHGLSDKPMTVIGVVNDYHQRSFRSPHDPLVFMPAWSQTFGWDKKYHFVKLAAGVSVQDQLEFIRLAWNAAAPQYPFSYVFLDEYFDRQYQADISFHGLFLFFSVFSLLITFLGLFAVVTNVAVNRTREIGIRKVLGASVRHILTMLSADFVKLVTISSAIAIPFAVWLAYVWLESFAFRITINFWMMIAPVIAILLTVLLVVTLRSVTVATSNPVDSIRYE